MWSTEGFEWTTKKLPPLVVEVHFLKTWSSIYSKLKNKVVDAIFAVYLKDFVFYKKKNKILKYRYTW